MQIKHFYTIVNVITDGSTLPKKFLSCLMQFLIFEVTATAMLAN